MRREHPRRGASHLGRRLTSATTPFLLRLADGWRAALAAEPALAKGLNAHDCRLTCAAIGEAFDLPTVPWSQALPARVVA